MNFLGAALTRAADGSTAFLNALVSKLASSASSTSTTVGASGLSLNLLAGATYFVYGVIPFQCASTTAGLKLGFAYTHIASGGIDLRVPSTPAAAASALEQGASATNAVTGANAATAASTMYAFVEGLITIDATGGALAIQFASTVSGQSVTLQAGSMVAAIRVA